MIDRYCGVTASVGGKLLCGRLAEVGPAMTGLAILFIVKYAFF